MLKLKKPDVFCEFYSLFKRFPYNPKFCPLTSIYFCDIINKSNTIFWNGPVGVFEFSNFSLGTRSIAKAIANATEKGAFSLVGGGDTIASLKIEKLEKKISYLSTGGGAMLESLKNQILPGIKALIL